MGGWDDRCSCHGHKVLLPTWKVTTLWRRARRQMGGFSPTTQQDRFARSASLGKARNELLGEQTK